MESVQIKGFIRPQDRHILSRLGCLVRGLGEATRHFRYGVLQSAVLEVPQHRITVAVDNHTFWLRPPNGDMGDWMVSSYDGPNHTPVILVGAA